MGARKKFKNQPRPLVRPSTVNFFYIFWNLKSLFKFKCQCAKNCAFLKILILCQYVFDTQKNINCRGLYKCTVYPRCSKISKLWLFCRMRVACSRWISPAIPQTSASPSTWAAHSWASPRWPHRSSGSELPTRTFRWGSLPSLLYRSLPSCPLPCFLRLILDVFMRYRNFSHILLTYCTKYILPFVWDFCFLEIFKKLNK